MIFKLGFIGCGNMASAIINGAVSSNFVKGESICVFDVDNEKAKKLQNDCGVTVYATVEELASNCDYVILAVKPQIFPVVLPQIKECLSSSTVVVSIAAGKTLEYIAGFLKDGTSIVRVMPNINAKVLASMSAICKNNYTDDESFDFVKGLCHSFGDVIELDQSEFALFGVIAGCSPAYSFMFIDAMAKEAEKNGMDKAKALTICAQAVLGSAKMILADKSSDPEALVKSVCSPGGTTIEGVTRLREKSFDEIVMSAVKASLDKDKKL